MHVFTVLSYVERRIIQPIPTLPQRQNKYPNQPAIGGQSSVELIEAARIFQHQVGTMVILKPFQLVAQLLLFLGGLYLGILGAFHLDIFQQLFPKGVIKTVELSIGLATVFLIILKFL